MRFIKFHLLVCCLLLCNFAIADGRGVRIKDIVDIEGIRENPIIGYGIVVGLNGTGDNLNNSVFTQQGLMDFLEKLGVNTRGANLKTKNVAAVTVSATLPAFARAGSRLPVRVNAIGDSKSLEGGQLVVTPMLGADGKVYAIADGPISISIPSMEKNTGRKKNPVSGFISEGAIIEREGSFNLSDLDEIKLALKNPDIATARSMQIAINSSFQQEIAFAKDPGTVTIYPPKEYKEDLMSLLGDIETIRISTDNTARIVIDEATGTVVIGSNVKIEKVAIAHGNLIVKVTDDQTFLYNIGAKIDEPEESEPGKRIALMKESVNLSSLVEGLNAIGVLPKDLVTILKTIQKAGALQAKIVVI